ncbi:MAG: UDP-N-acetylmuramyl-tripeptide synthetase [Lachnospiraceae bacterium]|nr:UDP-N-acetylmuramyl-tripeptide synthetase [Lachnospiraceae bacterium]
MITVESMAAVLRERGLLKEIEGEAKGGEITWLTCDSRRVTEGTLFICKGAAFREEYLAEAAGRGASSYISEVSYEAGQALTGLIVTDIRKAMAVASAVFFGYVPGRPCLTGITGTKGKTTTAWYLKAMLDEWMAEQGRAATGLLSTIQNYDGEKWEDAVMTTPEAPVLHGFLARAEKNGLSHVTMEVSSQALKYKRVRELRFQVGIFLNISEDHISPVEHEDFEDYFSSKLSMFRQSETACVNMDSEHRQRILKAARKAGSVVTFGRHPKADLRYSDVRMQEEGISFRVKCDRFSAQFHLAMRGRFNIENAMAAIAAGYVYGIPVHCMQKALARTKVPGRMETFWSSDERICGIVDFAHNRLSFERLFDAVFQEYGSYKKIITVFGCPGGKALNRRRELGLIAGLFSDQVLITSDDPGMECPGEIAGQIRGYVEMTGCACECIEEREEAVKEAVRIAEQYRERTMILLLGRGSEKYQRIGRASLAYPTDSVLMRRAVDSYDEGRSVIKFPAVKNGGEDSAWQTEDLQLQENVL